MGKNALPGAHLFVFNCRSVQKAQHQAVLQMVQVHTFDLVVCPQAKPPIFREAAQHLEEVGGKAPSSILASKDSDGRALSSDSPRQQVDEPAL